MSEKKKHILIIISLGILAWAPTLNFWFFKAYEASWLTGVAPYTIINLLKAHAFLYFIDWKIFGWNPWGWYLTGLIIYLIASVLFYNLLSVITKKNDFSLIASLIFLLSTSYNDVLTWGSFNAYYPLLLICMLLCLTFFAKFKTEENKKYYALSVLFAFLGFYVRETGIVIIPLITLFDFFFSKEKVLSRKYLIEFAKRQLPFYLTTLLFFFIRTIYGGTGGDTADSNVKLQMRFVEDHLYFEYAKASLLTIGKLVPPQIIPYELLNWIREFGSKFINYELMNKYFFPLTGFGLLGIFSLFYLKIKNNKNYSHLFGFFFAWLLLFSLFVSLAVPYTPEVLARVYEYNTMRYRFFAFVGTSVLISCLLFVLVRKVKILYGIIFIWLAINLLWIWKIEREVYKDFYKPAKEFYIAFNTYFPTLSTKTVFYLFPHAPALSDYLYEWNTIKDQKYSNLNNQPFRVESQIIAVLNKVKSKKINLEDVIFLDYSKEDGLINNTQKVKKELLDQKEYPINLKQEGSNIFLSHEFTGPFTDIPYNSVISYSSGVRDFSKGSKADSEKFKALVDYSLQRNEYLKTAKVKTAYTMSQREGEPFYHVLPRNLVDGNIGNRSLWIADTFEPWVEIDLGKEKEISAVAWGSIENTTRIPATYKILISKDGKTWEKVTDIKNSVVANKIDKFIKPVNARYVRMEIDTTSGGDFVSLDEFEVIDSSADKILNLYSDRNNLFYDAVNIFNFSSGENDILYLQDKGLNLFWGELVWETSKTTSSENNQRKYFPVILDFSNHVIEVEIPEGEINSGTGNFLNKYINKVSIKFINGPFNLIINSMSLAPRVRL